MPIGKHDFVVTENDRDVRIWGLSAKSNDGTQNKDIPALSKKYNEIAGKTGGEETIPFFIISSGYDPSSRNFQLFVGGLNENTAYEEFIIPKGFYIKVTVKPKMKILWGLAVGEAKRFFYTKWLPESAYTALNMEYEYHSEASIGKNPRTDIYFAVAGRG